jgi:hypothetical protein
MATFKGEKIYRKTTCLRESPPVSKQGQEASAINADTPRPFPNPFFKEASTPPPLFIPPPPLQVLSLLHSSGYRQVVLQTGSGAFEPPTGDVDGVHVQWFRLKPSIDQVCESERLSVTNFPSGAYG